MKVCDRNIAFSSVAKSEKRKSKDSFGCPGGGPAGNVLPYLDQALTWVF